MAASSRAAVWTGEHDFVLEERPLPEPGAGEVRVRVHACGVCMTEVHSLQGHFTIRTPPVVLGHEWGGTVEALGAGVERVLLGRPVAGGGMGGFADHAVVPAERVFPIADEVPLDAAAFVEPLACLLAALEHGAIRPGTRAVVTGAGPMGLMMLQLARLAGAKVLVSEPNAARRELAGRLGADRLVDPAAEPLKEAVAAWSEGRGAEVAFETAGHPAPLVECVEALADGGRAVIVGVAPATTRLDLPLYPFHRRNLTLIGSYGSPIGGGFAAAAARLGELELAPLVSHRYGLAEVAEAFEVAGSGRGLKVLVEPGR